MGQIVNNLDQLPNRGLAPTQPTAANGQVYARQGGATILRPVHYDTIADMLADTRTWGASDTWPFTVSGYWSKGDGGGGTFRYDPSDTTSASNGGTVFRGTANTANRFKRHLQPGPWDVRWFGADATGASVTGKFGSLAAARVRYPQCTLAVDGGTLALESSLPPYVWTVSDTVDWLAHQAAVELGTSTDSVSIFTPDVVGTYWDFTRPLISHFGFIWHGGGKKNKGTVVRTQGNGGLGTHPLLILDGRVDGSTTDTLRLTTPIVTGNTYSLNLNPSGANSFGEVTLAYNECRPFETLHGRSAFTVEFFARADSNPSLDSDIFACSGKRYDNDTQRCAFSIGCNSVGTIRATLTTSNGSFTATGSGAGFPVNTVAHVALTYDGSTLRLFVAGVLAASVAATGTVVQYRHETMAWGGRRGVWHYDILNSAYYPCKVGSLRVGSTARYTAGFTAPTTSHAWDGSSLLLHNFDSETANTSDMQTTVGTYSLMVHRRYEGGNIGGEYRGLFLRSTDRAVCGRGVIEAYFHNCYFEANGYGVHFYDNCYDSHFSHIQVAILTGGAAYGLVGLCFGHISGASFSGENVVTGFPYQVFTQSAQGALRNLFLHGQPTTGIPIIVHGEAMVDLTNVNISNEDGGNGQEAMVVVSGCRPITIRSCNFEASANAKPAIIWDGGSPPVVLSCAFEMHASATSVVYDTNVSAKGNIVLIAPSPGRNASLTTPICNTTRYEVLGGPSYSNLSALATSLASGVLPPARMPRVAVTYAATLTVNAALGYIFSTTMTGNVLVAPPSNPVDGQRITFELLQDSTGSRAITFAGGLDGFLYPGIASTGTFAPTNKSTAANRLDTYTFVYDSTLRRWVHTSESIGNIKPDPPLLQSLISHWTLNETSGSRLDTYGTNHLTDNSSNVTSTTGLGGFGAAVFPGGSSSYLTVNSNATLQTGDIDFTLSGWAKYTTVSSFMALISKGTTEYEVFRNDTASSLMVRIGHDSNDLASPTFPENTWFFWAVVHDSVNNLLRARINLTETSTSFTHSGAAANATAVRVGGRGGLASFIGSMQMVDFRKKVLSTGDLDTLYNSGVPLDLTHYDT